MANQEENSNVLTKLLSDSIPEEDAFGGHKKVADAIYGLINDEEEGGKAIALSGIFGSGKSTVVNFLKRKFNREEKDSKKETGIFIFDAWEHQGNPLRRAFIEEYVNFLRNDVGWANEKEYKEQLELVSKNREDISTTTEPFLTPLGGWFALLLLLIPLGLGLFRLGMVENSHWLIYWVGLAFLTLPFVYLAGVYICWRPYRKKQRRRLKHRLDLGEWSWKDFFTKHRPPFHRKSIFNFFSKKSREKIKSTSLKSPDPTTIEFQRVFNTITTEVLENKDRSLIVVIDNIDRLTTKSSIDAWTTLRTFFENENKDWEWKDQFWLIAPFDLKELKNLWSGLDHLNDSEKNGESEKTSKYVQAFVDKTFQVLFRVPQPVLSDWKEYFVKQLEIAFPIIKEEDQNVFSDIATLYQLKEIKGGESPTPRDIKQFINRVGAQYRIWHNEINLPALAYYELVSSSIEQRKLVQKLQKGQLVDPTFRSLIGEDKLNRKLAAIHFNCEIDKAYQVLFGDDVATALQEGKAESLKDYIDTEGFKDVLESVFHTQKDSASAQWLANCALCLSEIEESSGYEFNKYFHQLSSSFQGITSFKPFNKSIGEGIVTIWEKTGFTENWIVSMLTALSQVEIDEEDNTIKEWFSFIQPILEKLNEKGVSHLLKENLSIPGGATDYIKALSRLNKLDGNIKTELAKYLLPNPDQDQIVKAYSTLLNSDEKSDDLGGALYLQSFAEESIQASEWNWGNLVNQIKGKIQINTNAQPKQIEASLKMMLVLCYKFKKDGAIQLSNDQNFRNGLFFLINNQNDESLLALVILNSVLFNPNNQKTVNDNNVNRGLQSLNNILSNPSDKEFIRKDFLNYLIEFQLLEDFLDVQQGSNNLQKLPQFIIQNSFESDESEKALQLINSDIVFKYFDDLYRAVNEDSLSHHIKVLYDREDNLVDKIITKFETVPSNYREHYYFAKVCPDELREPYFEFLAEGFKNLEKDQWLKHLTDETELIYLAILIQQSGFDLELSVKLKNALEEHYKQFYLNEINPPKEYLISNWNYLLDSLDEDVKNTFLKSIKYHIESNEDGLVANIGYLYDSILIDEEIYMSDTGRFISTVWTRILKKDNSVELEWLKELIQKQPNILDQEKSATNAFKEEVKNVDLKNYSPEAQREIQEIASLLNVTVHDESEKDQNKEK